MRVQQPDLHRLTPARHLPSFTTVAAVPLVGFACELAVQRGHAGLTAVSGGETLAPGTTEIVPISAQGGTIVPGGCQFNGMACQP